MKALLLFYRALRRVNDGIAAATMALGMAIIAFAAVALFAAAVERYFAGRGYAWMNDLPPYLLPWCVFPLMGVLFRSGRHIAVEVAPSALSGTALGLLRLLVALIVLATGIYFCLAGIDATGFFRMLGEVTETEIQVPFWLLYAAFPAGFALLALFALESVLKEALDLAGQPVDAPAEDAVGEPEAGA